MAAGTQPGTPISSERAMAGASSDQKLAAIITPAAKPSIQSSTLRDMSRRQKTTAAPRAVISQVKQVASKAWRTGWKVENCSSMDGPLYVQLPRRGSVRPILELFPVLARNTFRHHFTILVQNNFQRIFFCNY
jgi:hypothetical protein